MVVAPPNDPSPVCRTRQRHPDYPSDHAIDNAQVQDYNVLTFLYCNVKIVPVPV